MPVVVRNRLVNPREAQTHLIGYFCRLQPFPRIYLVDLDYFTDRRLRLRGHAIYLTIRSHQSEMVAVPCAEVIGVVGHGQFDVAGRIMPSALDAVVDTHY